MTTYPFRQAVISKCGLYRYELLLRWGPGQLLEWVMLNPSTADAVTDDPTFRRCMGFAMRWGYAGVVIRNLYAYRSPNPDHLREVPDPIGPENFSYLANNIAARTIVGWGAHPMGANMDIVRRIKRPDGLYCLGVTASGMPRHPLYLPNTATPTRWESAA